MPAVDSVLQELKWMPDDNVRALAKIYGTDTNLMTLATVIAGKLYPGWKPQPGPPRARRVTGLDLKYREAARKWREIDKRLRDENWEDRLRRFQALESEQLLQSEEEEQQRQSLIEDAEARLRQFRGIKLDSPNGLHTQTRRQAAEQYKRLVKPIEDMEAYEFRVDHRSALVVCGCGRRVEFRRTSSNGCPNCL